MKKFGVVLENEFTGNELIVTEYGFDVQDMLDMIGYKYDHYIIVQVTELEEVVGMPQCCFICPYKEICESIGIYLDECNDYSDSDFNDPDFLNLIYKHKNGEDYWGEVSYAKYTDDSLDYGDLEDVEEEH